VDYLHTMYQQLAGQVKLFIGQAGGVPVTANLVTSCGEMDRGRLIGFDRTGHGRRLGVPTAVTWESSPALPAGSAGTGGTATRSG
jgi:hypothetical protein